jgi:hypothetical protein
MAAVAACIDLIEHLANDARLARSGVSDDQEVLVFGVARNAQRELCVVGRDANSGAADRLVEGFCIDEDWAFEAASVAQLLDAPMSLGIENGSCRRNAMAPKMSCIENSL